MANISIETDNRKSGLGPIIIPAKKNINAFMYLIIGFTSSLDRGMPAQNSPIRIAPIPEIMIDNPNVDTSNVSSPKFIPMPATAKPIAPIFLKNLKIIENAKTVNPTNIKLSTEYFNNSKKILKKASKHTFNAIK